MLRVSFSPYTKIATTYSQIKDKLTELPVNKGIILPIDRFDIRNKFCILQPYNLMNLHSLNKTLHYDDGKIAKAII